MKMIFFIRSIFSTIISILATGITAFLVIVFSSVIPSRKIADYLVWFWAHVIVKSYNIKMKVTGLENLPNEGCLFIFNHTSHLDIPIFHDAIKKSARFGAKIELFKIPLFGTAMRKSGALPIVRSDPGQVYKLYEQSISRVHAGESFVLAAEGTRQPVAGVGRKFKSGPFVFSISGQFPIVPVVIKGATRCLSKDKIIGCTDAWSHDVQVQILPPISTKGLTLESRTSLQEKAQNLMTKAYLEG